MTAVADVCYPSSVPSLFVFQGGVGHVDNEETMDLSTLVSCFFITYCISSFPASWFVERYGLRAGVLVGAWLQAIGCAIRVIATPVVGHPVDDEAAHGNLSLLMFGQVVASLGQAFWVNPPPLLAAVWFGVNERTLATTIACNANTLGIAVAFVLGPAIVDSVDDLPAYMMICAAATLATALLSTVYFPAAPPTPPSHSQVEPQGLGAESPEPATSDAMMWASPEERARNNNCSGSGASSSDGGVSASPSPEEVRVVLSSSPDSSAPSDSSDSEDDVEAAPSASRPQGPLNHSRSAPSVTSVSSSGGHKDPHHVRVRSKSEMAVADSYSSMTSPPCSFVRRSAILAERQRSKNASRILASARMFKRMFASAGFGHALLAFGVAEATINGLAAFISLIVEPWFVAVTWRDTGRAICATTMYRARVLNFVAHLPLFSSTILVLFFFFLPGATHRCSSLVALWSLSSARAWLVLPWWAGWWTGTRRSSSGS